MSSKKTKQVIRIQAPKPRNPLHALLASKRGGSHEPSRKAKRQAEKLSALRAATRADDDVGPFSLARPFSSISPAHFS